MPKVTEEEFQKRLIDRFNGKIISLENYKGCHEKIKFFNVEKQEEFFTTPHTVFRDKEASRLNTRRYREKHPYQKKEGWRYTSEKFNQLFELEPDYELLSEFTGLKNTVNILHKKCGKVYTTAAENFRFGRRCPYCSKGGYDLDKAKEKFKDKFGDKVTILEYNGWKNKGLFKCNECGKVYEAIPIRIFDYVHHGCDCWNQNGKNGPTWKGGVSEIEEILRTAVQQWKHDSYKYYNNKCIITNSKGNNHVHHVFKSFVDIRNEVFDELNIPLNAKYLKELTQEQLEYLRSTLLKKHYEYGLGVVLSIDLHKEFHKIYGTRNNTLEQFLDFAKSKGVLLEPIKENGQMVLKRTMNNI